MGIRVGEALTILHWLESRTDVDRDRIYIGGRGVGAVVALLAALLSGKPKKLVCAGMITHFAAMLEEYPNRWKSDLIIPEVLKYYDIPDLLAAYEGEVLLLNPLDGGKEPVSREQAEWIYDKALTKGRNVRILTGLDEREIGRQLAQFMLS